MDGQTAKPSLAFADELVDESMRLTGNLPNAAPETAKSGRWRPRGTVKVYDDVLKTMVGVEGVKVRAKVGFTTHTGLVDKQGLFVCDGTFRAGKKAKYSIIWERYDFSIQDGWLSGARHKEPNRKVNWHFDITDGVQLYYAHIFRAAHHYYYKNIKSLRRPPQNGITKIQLKIRAYNKSNGNIRGGHKPGRRFFGGNAIKIYNPKRKSHQIYATTIHELAHAAHWNMDRWHYKNSKGLVAESWARGVEWELTRMNYPNFKADYCNSTCTLPNSNYTGVVQDMIDFDHSPNDKVGGYSIRQIEDALKGKHEWNAWKNNIKGLYNNQTKNHLDALFNYWD